MYTKRIYSVSIMVKWTRRYIYQFIILAILPVFMYEVLGFKWLKLPWLPIGLVGTALAFVIGFKNNASYGRLWEARKIYGGIVNASRLLATMVNDFITNEHAKRERTEEEFFEIKKEIIHRHVAWMTCLRYALRTKKSWETSAINKSDKEYMNAMQIVEYENTLEDELEGYVTKEEKEYILDFGNKQNACLTLQSKHFRELQLSGLIEDFRHMEFKNMIAELFALQGKAERIKNFPYPRQFATLNLYFVWIFVIFLPFGLMSEFDKIGHVLLSQNVLDPRFLFIADNFVWLSIPTSVVISWIFFTMERVGDVSENPFEGIGNDVPISTMSRGIEIDIRQMIGEDKASLPAPLPQINDTQM
ncbi:bestrophin family protein [Flammeovirga sp. EKP202]|uniref:bestrophin family protein n=1 Tax=Flammeovirga sp. EKP202 TaxID=2770592 RepID=UPI00165F3ACB|nr:bestrophin family ion channel [Flammeovirga sp. EKP202]MBD0402963.1 hypothetical protein [Flammeovirga sp. EKP202]